MKLAVVIGHNSVAQGAVRPDTGESEWRFNNRIARHMEDMVGEVGASWLELRVFRRRAGVGYRREIAEVYAEVDAWGADASMELHFNAAADPRATGTEMLSSGTARSLQLAQTVQDEVCALLGLRDRGVKTRRESERGGGSLWAGSAPAILCEPFFGSSPRGQEAVNTREEERALAGAYLRGAIRAMKAWPRKNIAESRTLAAVERQKTAQAGAVGTGGASAVIEAAQAQLDKAGTQISALVGPDVLSYASAGLALTAAVLAVYAIYQSQQIQGFRLEDHAKGIR